MTRHAYRSHKKKRKMPANVRNYFKCINSGASKSACKKKWL